MIIIDLFTHNGRKLKRTYTDSEKTMLHKIGTEEYYDEAVDMIESTFEYEEVAIPEEIDDKNNIF